MWVVWGGRAEVAEETAKLAMRGKRSQKEGRRRSRRRMIARRIITRSFWTYNTLGGRGGRGGRGG